MSSAREREARRSALLSLDLLVLSRENIEPLRWAPLDEAFAESDLPFKVDLLDARDLEPGFRDRLMAGSVMIHAPAA